ncbi:MAG: hypothetical protein ACKVP2_15825 [Burkholderiales bacterium]
MTAAVRKAATQPEVKAKIADVGAITIPTTPDEMATMIRADIRKFGGAVKRYRERRLGDGT